MVNSKNKKYNLQITTSSLGKERIRFRGKFVKKYKMEKSLYMQRLNKSKKEKQTAKKKPEKTREKNDIPVDGSRITNLKFMAKQMFCERCNQGLELCNIKKEIAEGLGSIFEVQCSKCLHLTKVRSDEKHYSPTTKRSLFIVNTKMALGKFLLGYYLANFQEMHFPGALNGGMGETKANKFLTSIGLPKFCNKTFKKHERLVGPIVEQVARESCAEAVALEKELTEKNAEKLKLSL